MGCVVCLLFVYRGESVCLCAHAVCVCMHNLACESKMCVCMLKESISMHLIFDIK